VPRRRPGEVRARAWTTRAAARAEYLIPDVAGETRTRPERRDAVLDRARELFGGAWLSGHDVGLRWAGDDGAADAVPDAAPRRATGDTQAEAMELWQVVSRLPPDQRRRLLGTASAALSQLSPRQLSLLLATAQRALAVVGATKAAARGRSR
jgi:hypothetical protein